MHSSSGLALLTVFVSVASPAAAPVSAAPPWVVESPAAAGHGARFGLGLDSLFEHQESLRIDAQRTVTSLEIDGGGVRTDVVDGDPELLNRKFDLEWDLKGPGVEVPLALSCFRLTDLIRVFPTLTLEAATVDVTLGSISKTERSNPKVSLDGRGELFGVKLGATASLCGSCPWFMRTSYHYRSLPAFDADRSPVFSEPGFEVLHDEVRLSQEVHEVSTRFGYIAPNKRVAYYTGVRGRRTVAQIEDELQLRSLGYGQKTGIASRTRLESETIEAIAGVDAHLGGPIYGRTETTFNGQDYGVLVTVAYVGPRKASLENRESRDRESRENRETIEKQAQEIAGVIALSLRQILAHFQEARGRLPVDANTYPRAAVNSLLDGAERELLLALSGPDLTAMRDYFQDLFGGAREALAHHAQIPSSEVTVASMSALRYARLQRAQPAPASLDKATADSWLDQIEEAIKRLISQSENDDLLVDLCVKSAPKTRAVFRMHPISYEPPVPPQVNTNGPITRVWRGLYQYEITKRGFKPIEAKLDLVKNSDSILACQMVLSSEDQDVLPCDVKAADIERECPQ